VTLPIAGVNAGCNSLWQTPYVEGTAYTNAAGNCC